MSTLSTIFIKVNSIIFSISIVLAKVSVFVIRVGVGNAKLLMREALIGGLNESLKNLSLKLNLLCSGADRSNCFSSLKSI